MPLKQDRASLKNILLWISEVLTFFVDAIGRELSGRDPLHTQLVAEMRKALPTIDQRINAAIADLEKIASEGSPEWQRLKTNGLTDEQLHWKLTLLRTIFATTPAATQPVPTARPSGFQIPKKPTRASKGIGWVACRSPLVDEVLEWINRFLESLGLDIVKEFKEGVESVVKHQLRPTTLITLGEPRDW